MIRIKNKPQFVAIVLTAIAVYPIWQAFADSPLVLCTVVMLGIGYIITGSNLAKAMPLTLPVYGLSTLLFGFFAMFQCWRIVSAVVLWLDRILTDFFQWIQ